jgi:hypothetical protein
MWRNNGLSIALLVMFGISFAGQAATGWKVLNSERQQHGHQSISFSSYLGSGHFWEATGENWESEFLQMAVFVLLTTFLYQKGSAESKRIGAVEDMDLDPRRFRDLPDVPGPVRQGGWRLTLYENSLGLTFIVLFVISIAIHAGGGLLDHNAADAAHGEEPRRLVEYLSSADFWFESFQNWQSEFLSLAGMVIGTIWLRQRGSAESKPVHAAHEETGRS